TLSQAGVAQNLTGVCAVFDVIDLPADDHATEQVQEQILIVEATFNGRRQVGDVPAVDFIGRLRSEGPRLGLRAGRALHVPRRPRLRQSSSAGSGAVRARSFVLVLPQRLVFFLQYQ